MFETGASGFGGKMSSEQGDKMSSEQGDKMSKNKAISQTIG
ncbi:hypothetical protein [Paenibacillus athensensis]|nr:hypothetical protein [Paenibacillus athensensis]